MKKFLLPVFLLTGTVSFAQKKEVLLKQIKENITQIDQLMKLSNTRISFATPDTKFNPSDQSHFEHYDTYSEEKVGRFFDSLSFGVKLVHPYSFMSIDNDHFDLLKLMGKSSSYHMDHPEEKPRYTPKQITFLDGTVVNAAGLYCSPYTIRQQAIAKNPNLEEEPDVDTEKLSELEKAVWEAKSSFSETFAVYSPKPIKKVVFTVALPLRKSSADTLDNLHRKAGTAWGDITLDTIKGNQVSCTIPDDMSERLQILALYKDGRVLSQKSYSGYTAFSEKKKESLGQIRTALEEAKKKVNNNEITDQKALEAFVQAHVPAEETDAALQYKSCLYTFAGPVSRVVFVLSDTVLQTRTQEVVYTVNYDKDEEQYQAAADFKTGKTGIVNVKGNWVVQPEFGPYFRRQNAYFYWDQINDYEATYWLDQKTETLHKVPYRVDDQEVYAGKYVKIEPEINGKIGLIDGRTGKQVLPMQHDYLRLVENKYWHARTGSGEGVYDANMNTLIPFEFSDVTIHNGFFYTRTENDIEDVYNSKGENLTQGKYKEIDGYFNSGLLLVERYTIGADRVARDSKKFFIDTTGKVKIALEGIGFKDAEPFRSGLSMVRHAGTDKYGYIDNAGKLLLPCIYNSGHDFFEHSEYALVEQPGGVQMLIDKKGRTIKKFEEHYQFISRDKESGLFHIGLFNGKVYDEYGKLVEKQ
ncbi:hypothetical protein DBR32_00900 [Taibaiella sp. KBW10]|uniref:WG repeat-containing protein n=1 Tax=Taibaiella sp. KBW10 TaxID=2153357 RepID=UPI000F59C5B0|nr:WG repeat-containing protein [Taibaiella sp. KBW10]RQO32205.1 hypothetical protein DBR32_00900 [Taibaiella sp. KBW10]